MQRLKPGPKTSGNPKKQIVVYVTDEEKDALEKIATATGARSMGALVKHALVYWLSDLAQQN